MKLGLGAVQFGVDYGVTNTRGRVQAAEAERILRAAADAGLDIVDTAAGYGESETVLGAALWPGHPFRVVTKTPPLTEDAEGAASAGERLAEGLRRSLGHLRQPSVYGLLFHRPDDLAGEAGQALIEAALALKDRRLVDKVGASIYNGAQIDAILSRFVPDIIQVPLNVLDQRLVKSSHLRRLKALGVEVHARSIFLQGVLLAEPSALPQFFRPYREPLQRARDFARENGFSALQLTLGYVTSVAEVDVALIGVTSASELEDIVEARKKAAAQPRDWSVLACSDEKLVDPSRWRL